jgi:hypothetical protein
MFYMLGERIASVAAMNVLIVQEAGTIVSSDYT